MRGGEKVVETLCDMYLRADIFTHVYVPEMVSDKLRRHRIIPTFINALPRASSVQSYLPLMPLALEQLDLRGYDLIISSESGPSRILRRRMPSMLLLSYSDALYLEHVSRISRQRRPIYALDDASTRSLSAHVGRNLAARVDSFVANSTTVAGRIRRYYGMDSVELIHLSTLVILRSRHQTKSATII